MTSTKSRYPWLPKRPPIYVGVSSLFYLCPAIAAMAFEPGGRYGEMFLWFIVTLNSVMSDCFMPGRSSRWHIADRITSYLAALVSIAKPIHLCTVDMHCHHIVWLSFIGSFCFLFIPAAYFLVRAREANTHAQWGEAHFMWHVLSVASITINYYSESTFVYPGYSPRVADRVFYVLPRYTGSGRG